MTRTPAPDPPASGEPFARLTRELTELDYSPQPSRIPGCVDYTATDARITATVDHGARTRHAELVGLDVGGAPAWNVSIAEATPEPVQLIALYTVLHAGLGDEAAVLRAVATALGVDLSAEATGPAPPPAL